MVEATGATVDWPRELPSPWPVFRRAPAHVSYNCFFRRRHNDARPKYGTALLQSRHSQPHPILTKPARESAFSAFSIRSYRFQWPADLLASWAFEMEVIILGWYILTETGSVLMLSFYASLQYIGTLLSPLFGVAGHRLGNKRLLCLMRATYATLASTLMVLALTGVLVPLHVFIITALMGIVRPSDLVMRYALVCEIVPPERLMAATSLSRTTQDSARVVGTIFGAGFATAFGMGGAYTIIAAAYLMSLALTFKVKSTPAGAHTAAARDGKAAASPFRDLKDTVAYVWRDPLLRSTMLIAMLLNLTAFPVIMGLLPYVAKDIYHTDQQGLSFLVAGFASGALTGSLVMSRLGHHIRQGRTMIIAACIWYLLLIVFSHMPNAVTGGLALFTIGLTQSVSLVPMNVMILRKTESRFHGRVMGIRMLAVYGVPMGLLIAGPTIRWTSYGTMVTCYSLLGLALLFAIVWHWRDCLWRLDATANKR